jgi:hypothetical protein
VVQLAVSFDNHQSGQRSSHEAPGFQPSTEEIMHRSTTTSSGISTVKPGRRPILLTGLAGFALTAGVWTTSASWAVASEPATIDPAPPARADTSAGARSEQVPDPPEHPTRYVTQRVATDRALADFASREGLTGLSPVSLRPIDTESLR